MVFICQAHIFIGMKDGKYGVWFCTDVQMMPSAPYAPCDRILFRWPWGWICLWSCTADPQETPTGAWTDMAPTSAPSARMNGTAVYETRDKTMMIFGGLCSATEPCATLIWADGWMSLNGCGMSGGGGNFMESSSFGLQILWETLRKTSRYRSPVFFCFSCESWCPRHERFGSTMATTMFGRENGNITHSLTHRLLQLCMGTLQHLGKMHLEGEKLQNETGKNAPLKGDMKDKSRWHTAHDGVWYAFCNIFFQCYESQPVG